nr:PREDICTED: guanine nucleotide-binding protein G(I)/G(S)/G(O) subunit gamma-T2 [Opisthocomus hoazin]
MAQDMTEKELLKMELDQLKKEVKNERQMLHLPEPGSCPSEVPIAPRDALGDTPR